MRKQCFIFLLSLISAMPCQAQTQTFVLGGPQVAVPSDQMVMLEAANKMVQRDFKAAEVLYGQALNMNANNANAYLQRGLARRELGDAAGAESDARKVVTLSDTALAQDPRNAQLYYQRGMGYRLLKEFDAAKRDVSEGMKISGNGNWQADLQAIDLESRAMR